MGSLWWFLIYEDGPQITFYQVSHWMRCGIDDDDDSFADLDCDVFQDNHPNAMALSVLVTIEMLNAVNRFACMMMMTAFYGPMSIQTTKLSACLRTSLCW